MSEPEIVVVRRDTYYTERDYVQKLENLAAAVQLFWKVGPWLQEDDARWKELTGRDEATAMTLCDFARECQK